MNHLLKKLWIVVPLHLCQALAADDQANKAAVADGAGKPVVAEIAIADSGIAAENLTSTSEGTVYFGSNQGTIYRASPGAAQAEAWISASASGLTNVLGVLADEKSNSLWVCTNPSRARGEAPSGQTALRSFDLKTGEARKTYPFPEGGVCNDVAVAPDGAVYATDTIGARILRLATDGTALEVWISDPQLRGVDGLSFLEDGALYVNNFFTGALLKIPATADGKAGEIQKIETSLPFTRPDGLRTSGPRTLLQAEGQGRLTEIAIDGNRGQVRVIKEGFNGSSGVTQVGKTAWVLTDRRRAVPVPIDAAAGLGEPSK